MKKANPNQLQAAIIMALCVIFAALCCGMYAQDDAKMPLALRRFMHRQALQGASVAFLAKEVGTGATLYSYDAGRKLTPASVAKTVTTATALEILGADYRYETVIQYDGKIANAVLNGNIYIRGSGDPTTCSAEFKSAGDSIIRLWVAAVRAAGIATINGNIIADESIFDTEGVSMKWLREDLGSNYGQGSYGINIFDNMFALYVNSGAAGSRPTLDHTSPEMSRIKFFNYLTTKPIEADSFYITGFPYSDERYLYGVVRPNREQIKIEGDIPDPPLAAAQYFLKSLENNGITVKGKATNCRMMKESGEWNDSGRTTLTTTTSPPLSDIIRVVNNVSHNMFADALIKTLGLRYSPKPEEVISSFERGVKVVAEFWQGRGVDVSLLTLYDGSGLAASDKATANFLCDMHIYMAKESKNSATYLNSLPRAGYDGTVRTFLMRTKLAGSRLKSGSMTGVQCYAGYIETNGKQYAIALMINNFSGKNRSIRVAIEEMLLSLF
ncbi:MAG: D-alanyl-D-alanine carboxypeptidase/D-alanyl-D-alanine-endopeptidase [Tannerella sp.]|jgi:D-alanyl-D-alanine carboxypeptidase/D-alanyl-D-alanine-endopeptidase (penicillin-binding protein 4)|nr:D-alanyl-D-alanine carboxypeptidase/D-alanyl-D-alanine-endopeptidase [Tannerella sp.]